MARSGSGVVSKRGSVETSPLLPTQGKGLGATMDHPLVSKAKRTVNEAMNKDPQLALRFEYMVTSRQFNGKKVCDDPDAELLPSCCNKYHLLGTKRIVELLLYCEPSLSDKILAGMKKDDLEELQDFAFCLAKPCAVPSKTWGVLKKETRSRYISIGGRRLMVVKFVKHGGKKCFTGTSIMRREAATR